MDTDRWWERPAARASLVAVGVLVLVNAAAFLILVSLQAGQGDTVLTGVQVESEDVGGATHAELTEVIDGLADRRLSEAVIVAASEGELRTDRDELGASVDAERTADRAWERGRRGLWRALWDHLRARSGATVELAVEIDVDRSTLEAWARGAAAELSRAPRDASIAFVVEEDGDGEVDEVRVEATEPREGREVDPEDLADELEGEVDGPGELRVEVPTETTTPTIGADDLDAVRVDAERVVSGPVVLANPSAGDDLELQPAQLAELIAVEDDRDAPEGERLRLTSSADRLIDHLGEDGIEDLEEGPIDAGFSVDGDEIEIVGGTPGLSIDLDATAELVLELATEEESAPEDAREGELPGDTTEPEVTRDELEELGIEEEVSSFTTSLVPGQSRNHNIQLGADLLHGAIVEPGETFSLNDRLGPRTRERGFVENGYIDEDGELTEVVGGGSSQLGTTFFNAAWFAGIEILDFKPHSLYFERYPMGREATLSFGTIDVVVENDSPYAIYVATAHTDSSVTVRFFSTEWAEVDSWTGQPYDRVSGAERDGFTVEFGRTITYPDGDTRSENHVHRYEPED